MRKAKRVISSIYLFTNRNVMIFDENGQQIPELQRDIGVGTAKTEKEKKVLLEILNSPQRYVPAYFISNYSNWVHEITEKEFFMLMGWYYDLYLPIIQAKSGNRKGDHYEFSEFESCKRG